MVTHKSPNLLPCDTRFYGVLKTKAINLKQRKKNKKATINFKYSKNKLSRVESAFVNKDVKKCVSYFKISG